MSNLKDTNWLGQDIGVGDLVYNARRDGNGTIHQIGIVEKVTRKQGVDWDDTPKGDPYLVFHVNWLLELGILWEGVYPNRKFTEGARKPYYKKRLGQNRVNNLVKIDKAILDNIVRIDDEIVD